MNLVDHLVQVFFQEVMLPEKVAEGVQDLAVLFLQEAAVQSIL